MDIRPITAMDEGKWEFDLLWATESR